MGLWEEIRCAEWNKRAKEQSDCFNMKAYLKIFSFNYLSTGLLFEFESEYYLRIISTFDLSEIFGLTIIDSLYIKFGSLTHFSMNKTSPLTRRLAQNSRSCANFSNHKIDDIGTNIFNHFPMQLNLTLKYDSTLIKQTERPMRCIINFKKI